MLGMKNYTKKYIDECRSKVDVELSAYEKLVAAAKSHPASVKALETFEATFFNNMVLMLDYFFVHRLSGIDGKDGNPLNEVKILCNSMLNNNNIMTADNVGKIAAFAGLNAIKLDSTKSVLKYRAGDEIKLNEADFLLLSKAFFAEIESKYL